MDVYTDAQKESFDKLGYFITKDAVDQGIVGEMRDAARRVKEKVISGAVDVYTDWHTEQDPYHIGGFLSPQFDEPVFAQYYGSKPLLDFVNAQVGADLYLGNLAMFTNPVKSPYICQWHRDDGLRYDQDEEPEIEYLHRLRSGCRWELALVDDCALGLVPGSHRRYRTPEEIEAMKEGLDKRLPGDMVVELKAGETIFWNGDALHRAVHTADRERLTMSAYFPIFHWEEPQEAGRNAWLLDAGVREWLPESLHFYYDRWCALHTL